MLREAMGGLVETAERGRLAEHVLAPTPPVLSEELRQASRFEGRRMTLQQAVGYALAENGDSVSRRAYRSNNGEWVR